MCMILIALVQVYATDHKKCSELRHNDILNERSTVNSELRHNEISN